MLGVPEAFPVLEGLRVPSHHFVVLPVVQVVTWSASWDAWEGGGNFHEIPARCTREGYLGLCDAWSF